MCLCSPQSWQYRVSLKPLPLTLFPLDSLSLPPHQSDLLPMRPSLPPFFPPSSLLPLGLSSAHSPRYHIPPPFGPFLPAPLPALYPCHAIAHTHIVVRRVVAWVLVTLCRSRIVRTDMHQIHWYWSVVGHHFIDGLQLFPTFVEFLRPVKNSRLMSLGIISLTTNVFCASSINLNWCSYSATFNDHPVSSSFNSFASLHLFGCRKCGLQC